MMKQKKGKKKEAGVRIKVRYCPSDPLFHSSCIILCRHSLCTTLQCSPPPLAVCPTHFIRMLSPDQTKDLDLDLERVYIFTAFKTFTYNTLRIPPSKLSPLASVEVESVAEEGEERLEQCPGPQGPFSGPAPV